MDVFPDGRAVAYVERERQQGFRPIRAVFDSWRISDADAVGQLSAYNMRLSPDGRAMTFVAGADEGRMDVYVSTVPVTSLPILVAERVSGPARWSRDGSRIYYMSGDGQR